jgi:hypothetical protein
VTRRFAVGFVLWLAVSIVLLTLQYTQVIGNLEAQVILGGWPAIGAAAWIKARMDRHHAAVHARLDAQDAAMKDAHRKIADLHTLHVEGRVPLQKRIVRP